MPALLIALAVFLLVGLGGHVWLRRRMPAATPDDDRQAGLAYLASLRWREFTRLVLALMRTRQYRVLRSDGQADDVPADGGDILLEREGQRTLLACKYGTGAVVGSQPLMGLAKAAELRGATHVIVVSPGRFDDEARRLGEQQGIELIDGEALWPQLRPLVDASALPLPKRATPPLHQAAPWLVALVLAALAGWLAAPGEEPAETVATGAPATVASAPRPAAPAAAAPASSPAPSDPAELERRRKEAADAISTLPGVARALWSTQSTLLVYLASEDADPLPQLCPLLVRYEELAPSRVQLQPPPDSHRPVRFRQCRTF